MRISPSSAIVISTSGSGLPDRADADLAGRHERADGGVLGLPVDLVDGDPERPEPLQHLRGDGRRAAHRDPRAREAELVAQRAQRERARRGRPHAVHGRELARHPLRRQPLALAQRVAIARALEPRRVGHPDLDRGEHLLPHARDRREDRRLHVAQVLRERGAALAEVDDVAGGGGVDHRAEALGDVAQRQVGEDLVVAGGVEGLLEARRWTSAGCGGRASRPSAGRWCRRCRRGPRSPPGPAPRPRARSPRGPPPPPARRTSTPSGRRGRARCAGRSPRRGAGRRALRGRRAPCRAAPRPRRSAPPSRSARAGTRPPRRGWSGRSPR